MSKFSDELKKRRKDKNMTQFDLAVDCGASMIAIMKWEGGKSLPSLPTAAAISKSLEWSDMLEYVTPEWSRMRKKANAQA